MLTAIKQFMDGVLHHVTKKEELLDEVNNVESTLKTDILPSIKDILVFAKETEFQSDEKKRLGKVFQATGSKESDPVRFLNELYKYAEELLDGVGMLENVIKVEFPDVSTDKTTTARLAGITGTLNNITSVTLFIPDLLLLLLYSINDEKLMYAKKTKQVNLGAFAYSVIFKQYRGNLKKVIASIKHLSDTVVTEDFAVLSSGMDKKFKMPVNNFLGNPIYHFRMWLVDVDIKKLENLKDKRELIKLKIAAKKSAAAGEPNPQLEKQVEYYEDKLADVEYKITRLEES